MKNISSHQLLFTFVPRCLFFLLLFLCVACRYYFCEQLMVLLRMLKNVIFICTKVCFVDLLRFLHIIGRWLHFPWKIRQSTTGSVNHCFALWRTFYSRPTSNHLGNRFLYPRFGIFPSTNNNNKMCFSIHFTSRNGRINNKKKIMINSYFRLDPPYWEHMAGEENH